MSNNATNICLTNQQMRLHGNEVEKYLQRFLYPCIVILGITGNVLNLTVLLNRSMRSRSNIFLAALAIADIIFLLLLLPNVLATYPIFTYNYTYRYIYFHIKIHLLSLTNWVSSAAIWLVVAVCADRLIGIRRPLHAKTNYNKHRIPLLIAVIVTITGIVNFYQHFQYKCFMRNYCNRTQIYSRCILINNDGRWFRNRTNPYSVSYRNFIDIGVTVNAITTIILPIILLSFFNFLLLCILRNRRDLLLVSTNQQSLPKKKRSLQYLKMEHRVTLMVTLIVTTFIILNGPSAVIHLVNLARKKKLNYNFTLLGNTLVIIDKACNFIVFCLTSQHFRARLFQLTQRKVNRFSVNLLQIGYNMRHVGSM
ncbi:G protein-coupled receptor [Loa loa]|uniref:G protein-coupled receptor n=1 Tax=Loa loa TaxID=7209 RepID=A0A1S0TMS9_LOALO|nr:G protein-coupled receptor [Loa loa]EFO16126.1 G protein-coupled receptor [Loa loa]